MARLQVAAALAAFLVSATAVAQQPNPGATSHGVVPREEGNRANGLNYQPTPGEVGPRERAAGIQPPAGQENAANQDLERIDKTLMRDYGLRQKSVPKLNNGQ